MPSMQELRVRSTILEPTPTKTNTIFNIGFLTKTDKTDKITLLKTKEDIKNYIIDEDDLKEALNGFDQKAIYLVPYSDEIFPNITDIENLVTTLILPASASKEYLEGNLKEKLKDYKKVLVLESNNEDILNSEKELSFAKESYHSIFLDTKKEGHSLYAFTHFLLNYPVCAIAAGIGNDNFTTTIKEKAEIDALVDAGISFFVNGVDGASSFNDVDLWDIYIGNIQAQYIYAYYSVEYETQKVIFNAIKKGLYYQNDDIQTVIAGVEAKLSNLVLKNVLKDYKVIAPKVETQSGDDKKKGIYRGLKINLDAQSRVAMVEITIDGEE